MEFITVKIEKPDAINFVLGQTHFIKSVEDIHEALVAAVPGIQFGLAFCEASGKCLVRWSGSRRAGYDPSKGGPILSHYCSCRSRTEGRIGEAARSACA